MTDNQNVPRGKSEETPRVALGVAASEPKLFELFTEQVSNMIDILMAPYAGGLGKL